MAHPRPAGRIPGDFSTSPRVVLLAAMAVIIGSLGVVVAWLLLGLITLCTNVAYAGRFSFTPYELGIAHLGWLSVLIPIAGGVVIGLMARFGSEKIRGHGIPEAMEAILIGQSRIEP
ncbi:MAG: hypothetical protein JO157_18410, partial [Acetobacteraceae bacterium]|nr:hypothetical protein [Acetobacteraceae bacterium]